MWGKHECVLSKYIYRETWNVFCTDMAWDLNCVVLMDVFYISLGVTWNVFCIRHETRHEICFRIWYKLGHEKFSTHEFVLHKSRGDMKYAVCKTWNEIWNVFDVSVRETWMCSKQVWGGHGMCSVSDMKCVLRKSEGDNASLRETWMCCTQVWGKKWMCSA